MYIYEIVMELEKKLEEIENYPKDFPFQTWLIKNKIAKAIVDLRNVVDETQRWKHLAKIDNGHYCETCPLCRR